MTDLHRLIQLGREKRVETIEVAGRLQRHVENCGCSTAVMWWPCQDIEVQR